MGNLQSKNDSIFTISQKIKTFCYNNPDFIFCPCLNMGFSHPSNTTTCIAEIFGLIAFTIAFGGIAYFFGAGIGDIFGGIGDITSLFNGFFNFITSDLTLGEWVQNIFTSGYKLIHAFYTNYTDFVLEHFPDVNSKIFHWMNASIVIFVIEALFYDFEYFMKYFKTTWGYKLFTLLNTPITWFREYIRDMNIPYLKDILLIIFNIFTLPFECGFFLISLGFDFIISIF